MLSCCKATECKLTYGCTFKPDLIAQHPELVTDLSGKRVCFWRPLSGQVFSSGAANWGEITTGVSAGNCPGKVKKDNRGVRKPSLLRDQNESTSGTNSIRGEGLGPAERLMCVQDNKAVLQIWHTDRCLAVPKAAAASSLAHAVPIPCSANLD